MRKPPEQAPHTGFTLIEVMIAVAVVAILATIAVPSYKIYVERANRTVAKTALSELVSRQQSYYVDRKRYAVTFRKLGWGADTLYLNREGTLLETNSVTQSIYEVKLAGDAASTTCPASGSASAGGYTVVARPINAQVGDTRCATMCLSSSGIKSASGTHADDCWSR